MKYIRTVIIFCLLGLLVPHAGGPMAASLVALSLEGLVSYSDIAVIGKPESIKTHRDRRGKIVRSVTFEVDEYVTGHGENTITIRLQGGTMGDVAQYVPGEVKLTMGETFLLFLESVNGEGAGVFLVSGMAQGRFNVVTYEKNGERFVTRTQGDLNLIGQPHDNDYYGLAKPQTSTFVPLGEFVKAIQDIARRVPKVKAP